MSLINKRLKIKYGMTYQNYALQTLYFAILKEERTP